MNRHLFQVIAAFLAECIGIPDYQQIIIALPSLEKRLAARNIGVKRADFAPDRVARIHFEARVETPAWPCRFDRRVAKAVIEYMVYARKEESIDEEFYFAGFLIEVLVNPRAAFCRYQCRALYMGSGRREFRYKNIAVFFAEHFCFGNICETIEI